ncbi:MAG: stealth conserved region 3 domain-containing protein [Vicinamibacterales bacterium]
MSPEPVDIVYTWVDGAWPGYDALLRRYASSRHDLNPNRYRDNLSVLKYSLRSLERFVPWVRHVILVTCRPQVPVWLNPRQVRVVHHDEFIPSANLPTFNSFAIVSQLHQIAGISRRFVYLEDDRLFGAPTVPADFFDASGRVRVYEKLGATIAPRQWDNERLSPWNRALAYSNQLLNERYGAKSWRSVEHAPLAVDVDSWRQMIAQWPEAFRHTAASRFRATRNVAAEHLYQHFLLAEGLGVRVPLLRAYRHAAYHPLNNAPLLQRALLARLRWQRPKFFALNDNFGERPHPVSVRLARRFLDEWFPTPSRFETAGAS